MHRQEQLDDENLGHIAVDISSRHPLFVLIQGAAESYGLAAHLYGGGEAIFFSQKSEYDSPRSCSGGSNVSVHKSMSIQDTSKTTRKPGDPVYGNSVDSDLATLQKGRAHAMNQNDAALIAIYDEQIARLMNANLLQKTKGKNDYHQRRKNI